MPQDNETVQCAKCGKAYAYNKNHTTFDTTEHFMAMYCEECWPAIRREFLSK